MSGVMAKNSLRSAVVLVLLLGTLALAVPYVSTAVDAWLFSEGPELTRPKWNTQRPTDENALKPANPALIPPGKQLTHDELPSDDGGSAPFAFEFQDEKTRPGMDVSPAEHLEPAAKPDDANSLARLQQEIQALGAVYLTVERDGERFECRTLFPLAPESSYQKAFSAIGSTPQAAMEQVLAEVHNWQRAARRR
jgi:hypothetical protein